MAAEETPTKEDNPLAPKRQRAQVDGTVTDETHSAVLIDRRTFQLLVQAVQELKAGVGKPSTTPEAASTTTTEDGEPMEAEGDMDRVTLTRA